MKRDGVLMQCKVVNADDKKISYFIVEMTAQCTLCKDIKLHSAL